MAGGIIPRLNEQVGAQVSHPVPIHSPESAGIADEAQAQFWGQVTRTAGNVGEFFQKQQDMEDRLKEEEYSNKVKDSLMLARDKAQREAANDGSDYLEKFNKNVDEMKPQVMEGLEQYPGAQERVNHYAGMAYNSVKTQVLIDSAKMKETDNFQTMENLADRAADRVRGNPKPEQAQAEFRAYGAMLDDLVDKGTVLPKNRVKIMDAFKSKMAQQYVEGLGENKQFTAALRTLQANQEDSQLFTNISPDQAKQLGFIDSTKQKELESQGKTYDVPVLSKGKFKLDPAMAEIMSGMDPKTKSHYIDALQSKAMAEGATRISEVSAQVSGFERFAMGGGQYSDQDLGKLKAMVNSNPYLDEQARIRINDRLNTADAVNKQVGLLADTPREKWGDVIAGFDKRVQLNQDHAANFDPRMANVHQDFAVQANRMEAKEKLEKYAGQIQQMQDKAPAQYVLGTDDKVQTLWKAAASAQPQDLQNYAQATLAKQAFLGIQPDNQKILPNADSVADMLKNQPSAADAAQFIDGMQQKWGPYFPRVMAEITDQDKSLKKYTAAIYASPQVRSQVADAVRNEKSINEAFMATPGAAALHASIRQEANMALQPLAQTLMNGANSSKRQEIVNGLRNAIELQVRREAIKPGADVSKLVDEAYKSTIDSQFQLESGGQSNALVPRNINGTNIEPGIISAFMRAHSTADGIAELNPMVPKSYSSPDTFHQAIEREGRWLTNDSFDGMQLKLRNPETGQFMPVLDKLGKPIEVKYLDINLSPSASTKKQSTYLGRMFQTAKQGATWVNRNVEYEAPFN